MLRLHPRVLICILSVFIRCCPEVGFAPLVAMMRAWLSMYCDTFFPIVSGVLASIHAARIAPVTSASYVLCFSGGPRYTCSDLSEVACPFLYRIAAAPMLSA